MSENKKKHRVTPKRVLIAAAVAGAGYAFRRNIAQGLVQAQQAAGKRLYPETAEQ